MLKFLSRKTLNDGTDEKDQRIGLLYIWVRNSSFDYKKHNDYFHAVLEVREIFRDKNLSKIEVISIPFKREKIDMSMLIPWIESSNIYWLSPPTDVDRDRKIEKIIN